MPSTSDDMFLGISALTWIHLRSPFELTKLSSIYRQSLLNAVSLSAVLL